MQFSQTGRILPHLPLIIDWFKALYVLADKSIYYIQINLMKSIQILLDAIKELISEAAQNRSGYDNMRLIPIPVKNQERQLPNNNNNQ